MLATSAEKVVNEPSLCICVFAAATWHVLAGLSLARALLAGGGSGHESKQCQVPPHIRSDGGETRIHFGAGYCADTFKLRIAGTKHADVIGVGLWTYGQVRMVIYKGFEG